MSETTDDLIARIEARVLRKHGGTGDPMGHWNLSDLDSELHAEAAAALRAAQEREQRHAEEDAMQISVNLRSALAAPTGWTPVSRSSNRDRLYGADEMSFNGTMDDFIAAVRRDPALVEIVRDLQTHRYAAPAKFEALLWLALANSMCIGARDVLREMNPPEPKTPA